MKIVVFKGDKKAYEGSPINDDGTFPKEMPEPVRSYLNSAWDYWKDFYEGDFSRFWVEYVSSRMPSHLGLAMQGFSFILE